MAKIPSFDVKRNSYYVGNIASSSIFSLLDGIFFAGHVYHGDKPHIKHSVVLGARSKMSSRLNELDKYKFEYNLNIINPPLSYVNQANIDRFAIGLCLEIPYPLLRYWGTIADKKVILYKVII